jgi:hypothetical protein
MILISSCNQHSESIDKELVKNEDTLIKDLFWELVRPLPPFAPEDSTMEGLEIYWSNYATWVYENKFELFVRDSLFLPDKYFYQQQPLIDTFDSLYTELFTDKTISPRKFNLSLSSNWPNLKIASIKADFVMDSTFQEKVMHHNLIGLVEFSRVRFNSGYTKACFYFAKHQGSKSGGGSIIFAEKKKEKWTILKRQAIWVS